MRRRLLLAAILPGLVLVACRQEGVRVIPRSELPDVVYGSPRPSISPSPLPPSGVVYFVRRGRVHAVTQTLQPVTSSLPEALMLSLLAGPTGVKGVTTTIPAGTRLNGVEVEGTVATVDLSGDFEPGSPRSQVLRVAQVVFTLTEPGTGIYGVRFSIDGVVQEAIQGLRLTAVNRPVNRADYSDVGPEPTPTPDA